MNDLKTVRDALDIGLLKVRALKALWDIYHAEDKRAEKSFNEIETALTIALDRMIETPAPQGWKLVPEIPTDEIIEAMYSIVNKKTLVQPININELYQSVYQAMLSAAPTPAPTEKVDLDALKRDLIGTSVGSERSEAIGWNACVDHLANTGRLR